MSHDATSAPGSAFPEAGPIRVSTAYDPRTSWGALLFTVLAGAGLVSVALNAPQWTRPLFTSSLPAAPAATPAPSPTPIPTQPPVGSLASQWVSQSGYPGITIGGLARITVVFKNTGTAEWVRGTASEIRLGVVGRFDPAMASDWPFPERPAIQARPIVRPGELVTFTFAVRGTEPGTYRLHLRPVVDGVAWLNDEGVFVDVEVR